MSAHRGRICVYCITPFFFFFFLWQIDESGYEHPPADMQCMDAKWQNTILCIQLLSLDQSEQAYPNLTDLTHNQDIMLVVHLGICTLMWMAWDGLDVTKLAQQPL